MSNEILNLKKTLEDKNGVVKEELETQRSMLVKELQQMKKAKSVKKKPVDFHKITSDPILKIYV